MNSLFSMFSIERPYILLLLLLVPLVFIFMLSKFKKVVNSLGDFSFVKFSSVNSPEMKRLKKAFFCRTILRLLAFSSAVFAFSGISLGSKQVPVQKSGFAVSFVFDISYSMNAVDEHSVSRLEAVKNYAKNLLSRMDGISVSAVLAKGDGFVAIPLTEDFSAINSLIDSLSPYMMTAAGSSIGRGIECAASSFPQNSVQSNYIFVFTDGDETDDALYPSLMNVARFQIPVFLIGFGSEDGTEVLSGDGKTPVKTFLMANKMKNLAADVNKNSKKIYSNPELVRYYTAASQGSAVKILNSFKTSSETFAYENRPVPRHDIFLFLSVIFFVLSFVMSEIDLSNIRKKIGMATLGALVFLSLVSCSSSREKILEGAIAHYNGNLRGATADFLGVAEETNDAEVKSYALFGLASTYISLEEYDMALEKLNSIVPEKEEDDYKNPQFASAVFYNMGIIQSRKGDLSLAKELFKKAVLADSENLNAKINFELCAETETANKNKAGATEIRGVSEEKSDSEIDSKTAELFNLIRESEQNQWKKMESKEEKSNVLDY